MPKQDLPHFAGLRDGDLMRPARRRMPRVALIIVLIPLLALWA